MTVTVTPPQKISATWNGSPAWDGSGNVMTMRPKGNGSPAAGASTGFGFTVMTNGGTAPPSVGACTASWPPRSGTTRPHRRGGPVRGDVASAASVHATSDHFLTYR